MSFTDRLTSTVQDWLGATPVPLTANQKFARLVRILHRVEAFDQATGMKIHWAGWLLGHKACGEIDVDIPALRKQAEETADAAIKRASEKIEMSLEFAQKERQAIFKTEFDRLSAPAREGAEMARLTGLIIKDLLEIKKIGLIDFDTDETDEMRNHNRLFLCPGCDRLHKPEQFGPSSIGWHINSPHATRIWLTPFGKDFCTTVRSKNGFYRHEADGTIEWTSLDEDLGVIR